MSPSPIRVLLWSPRGSGEHYNGPASFTYRLYSNAPPGVIRLTLAHGTPEQDTYPLFYRQHLISKLGHSAFGLFRFLRRGRQWIDRCYRDFDVLHGISAYHSTVLPAAFAQRKGLPSIVFVSNHNVQLEDKPGIRRLLGFVRTRRRLIRELSGIVAMSEAIHEELVHYGIPEDRIARIPMGVNTRVFFPAHSDAERRELRQALGWLDLPTVVFVGALVRRKRPDLLVEAVGLLKRRGVDCQLALIGPESDRRYVEHMKDRTRELGVHDQIVWFGFTQDIARIFRAADLFSLPSSNEGMSAALIEAMASGLPPIVTAISGSTDAVEEGRFGRFVGQDAQEIADVLLEYFRNPDLVDRERSEVRRRVEERFSNEAVFSAYESMFRRVMAGGPAAG